MKKRADKIKLVNTQTREHSLYYAKIWDEVNRKDFDNYILKTNIKNMLFVREGKIGVLKIYYSEQELEKVYKQIASSLNRSRKIFNSIVSGVDRETKFLEKYASKERRLENLKDLKKLEKCWKSWWAGMAFVFAIPNIRTIDGDIRKKALEKRKEIEKYSGAFDNVFLDFFENKFPKYKSLSSVLLPEEVFSIQWDNDAKDKSRIEKVKKRLDGYALLNGKIITLGKLGDELRKKNLFLEELNGGDEGEIKGTVAFPGRISGKVKVISIRKDLETFSKGEILVTHMTSPEYLPQMKIAKAIITDEGGITCHAAIVAREMKKPCIIGTKIATQVLKDGDLVEVDANKGMVRILKKVKKLFIKD